MAFGFSVMFLPTSFTLEMKWFYNVGVSPFASRDEICYLCHVKTVNVLGTMRHSFLPYPVVYVALESICLLWSPGLKG